MLDQAIFALEVDQHLVDTILLLLVFDVQLLNLLLVNLDVCVFHHYLLRKLYVLIMCLLTQYVVRVHFWHVVKIFYVNFARHIDFL